MIDELRHAFELAQQQDEAMQQYIAALITQELAEDEIEVSPELALVCIHNGAVMMPLDLSFPRAMRKLFFTIILICHRR